MNTNNNYCRICLDIDKKREFLDIFSKAQLVHNKTATISTLVKECSSVNIEHEDEFPKLICAPCFKNLNIAYKFKELCLKTDKKLRENNHLKKSTQSYNLFFDNQESSNSYEILSANNSEPNIEKSNFQSSFSKEEFVNETKRNLDSAVYKGSIVCEICGKVSGHEANFEIHMRTHTGDKPFSCFLCGVNKTNEGDLKSHMKIHSDEYKYSCHICGKPFKWLSNHLRHMRWHNGEKTHKCNVCGKLFFEAGNVKKHMLTHTGEKPYVCQLCEKAFIRKNLLRKHYKIMHNTTIQSDY